MPRFLSLLFGLWLFNAPAARLAAQPARPTGGDGLRGDYYAGRNFEQFRLRRVDATINFQRQQEPPAEGMPAEDYSVRWTGWLRPPASGRYVLYLTVDDGARLWLDGRQVLDEWRGQAVTTYTVELNLRAGHAYALRLDYCQYGATSSAWLGWVQPAQFARADSAATWRTLWGLTASEPRPGTIPTRYLFSHNPEPPAPPPAAPVTRPPAPRTPPVAAVRQRPAAQPAAPRRRVPRPAPAALPAAAPAAVAAPPTGMAGQLAQGQAVTLRALYFAQGKAELRPASAACLDTLAAALLHAPALRLQVQGHTDNQGDSTLNRQLSQQRAEAVCRYLTARGVAAARLQALGLGGTRPVADNEVPALRARNRRVVLQPLP